MATTSTEKQKASVDAPGDSARRKNDGKQDSLEQLQGILFGEKMDEIEDRLAEIESRMHARLDKMSREMNSQIGNLRDEVKVKTDRLNDSNQELSTELANVDKALLDHSKQVTVKMASANQDLADEFRGAIADLDGRKVDGVLLSAFLSETAKGLAPKA